jgi:hypothetical protein
MGCMTTAGVGLALGVGERVGVGVGGTDVGVIVIVDEGVGKGVGVDVRVAAGEGVGMDVAVWMGRLVGMTDLGVGVRGGTTAVADNIMDLSVGLGEEQVARTRPNKIKTRLTSLCVFTVNSFQKLQD